jgi:hypothetical protein
VLDNLWDLPETRLRKLREKLQATSEEELLEYGRACRNLAAPRVVGKTLARATRRGKKRMATQTPEIGLNLYSLYSHSRRTSGKDVCQPKDPIAHRE